MRKLVGILIILLLLSAAGILYFQLFASKETAICSSNLELCNDLYYNEENGINIVIFSENSTAKLYADNLLSVSPFKDNKQAFNFYYIDSFTPSCELYQDIALFCYSKDLMIKASSCPNDYIVVIQENETHIRSSSYMNVLSINSASPISVFAHEFGHAFANLAEEYIPADIPRGSKNCVKKCDAFTNSDGCFGGCSVSEYYRSIENGIMRTLYTTKFGSFNEFLLSQKIDKDYYSALTGSAIADEINCNESQYYLIEGNYASSSKQISISSKTIETGCVGRNGAGAFNYSVTYNDNSQNVLGDFNAELIFTDSQNQNQEQIEGETFKNEGNFYLKVPVIENAKSLEVSTPESKALITLSDINSRPCEVQ